MKLQPVLFFVFFLVACSKGDPGEPAVPAEKFAIVLAELSVEEAGYSRITEFDSSAVGRLAARNAEILRRHGMTRDEFMQTYQYFNLNKKELVRVYDLSLEYLMKKMEGNRKKPVAAQAP